MNWCFFQSDLPLPFWHFFSSLSFEWQLWLPLQILGLVENMSCFICPHCSEPSFIFGKGGTHRTAAEMGLKVIGEVFWFYSFILSWLLLLLFAVLVKVLFLDGEHICLGKGLISKNNTVHQLKKLEDCCTSIEYNLKWQIDKKLNENVTDQWLEKY